MNYVHRAYGDTDYKDMGDSLLLWPGEKPRQVDPFPDTDTCPHCGNEIGNIRRDNFFRCFKCGCLKERFTGEVLPLTEEMKKEDFGTRVNVVCAKCGRTFNRLAIKKNTICKKCSYLDYQREYQKKRQRARRLQNANEG